MAKTGRVNRPTNVVPKQAVNRCSTLDSRILSELGLVAIDSSYSQGGRMFQGSGGSAQGQLIINCQFVKVDR